MQQKELPESAKTLVLGKMPAGASPQSHLAAGPWCFAGIEDRFPHWETEFCFAPEPLQDHKKLCDAAEQAKRLCAEMLPQIARHLAPPDLRLPQQYWETLLLPWAVKLSEQITERWSRVQAMLAQWGEMPLAVPLLPDNCEFLFEDDSDVILHGALDCTFNHWIFSRLLESAWPCAWRKVMLPSVSSRGRHGQKKRSLRQKWISLAKEFLLKLPCPPLKGMSLGQSLIFSLALLHPCKKQDHSAKLADLRQLDSSTSTPHAATSLKIFLAALPESIKQLHHPQSIPPCTSPRPRIAHCLAYEDARYRQELAIWRAKGHRLVFAQHGSDYGQVRFSCAAALVEYSQSAFITWGWKDYAGHEGNFVDLPVPQLAKIENAWHAKNNAPLLFVGTEMATYAYRLDSHPTPLQFLKYRQDKKTFMDGIGPNIRAHTLYRPYFAIPSCLQDASWLLARFPDIRQCEGALLPQVLACRLLVMDHNGTTFLEAMAANVPTVAFWSVEAWPHAGEYADMVSKLGEVGIWFSSPGQAAKKVCQIWQNPLDWWLSDNVQEARKFFCEQYARATSNRLNIKWIKALNAL